MILQFLFLNKDMKPEGRFVKLSRLHPEPLQCKPKETHNLKSQKSQGNFKGKTRSTLNFS